MNEFIISDYLPLAYFLAEGFGESDLDYHTGAYHNALYDAKIHNQNIMTYSSMLAKDSYEISTPTITTIPRGAELKTIIAEAKGTKGDLVSAGLAFARIYKDGEDQGGIVCELARKISEVELRPKLKQAIWDLFEKSYGDQYTLEQVTIRTKEQEITKKYGSVLVAMCFPEHQVSLKTEEKPHVSFLGIPCDIEIANYVIQPLLYDGSSSYVKGAAKGPSHILSASQELEDYHIPTKSQAFKAGIHTAEPIKANGTPEQMIELFGPKIREQVKGQKFPIFLGGEHSISIPIIEEIVREYGDDVTILQLDAHGDLREEYLGSKNNHACVMKRALDHTSNIFQWDIRSMSAECAANRTNLMLADQINEDPNWLEPVMDKLSDKVYITLDVDVFDPSLIQTGTPEPNGASYSQVMTLLKAVAQKKQIVGMDVVEFCPLGSNHAPAFMLAKLIYEVISYMEAAK